MTNTFVEVKSNSASNVMGSVWYFNVLHCQTCIFKLNFNVLIQGSSNWILCRDDCHQSVLYSNHVTDKAVNVITVKPARHCGVGMLSKIIVCNEFPSYDTCCTSFSPADETNKQNASSNTNDPTIGPVSLHNCN